MFTWNSSWYCIYITWDGCGRIEETGKEGWSSQTKILKNKNEARYVTILVWNPSQSLVIVSRFDHGLIALIWLQLCNKAHLISMNSGKNRTGTRATEIVHFCHCHWILLSRLVGNAAGLPTCTSHSFWQSSRAIRHKNEYAEPTAFFLSISQKDKKELHVSHYKLCSS